MTPDELAALHARASTSPWSVLSFAQLLEQPSVFVCCTAPHAFCLGRQVADEAELLQIATAPEARRKGFGRQMLRAFELDAAKRGAQRGFLEVDASNTPALALYTTCGWSRDGLRKGYYRWADGSRSDAVLMSKSL